MSPSAFIHHSGDKLHSAPRCFCRDDSSELDLAFWWSEGRNEGGGAVIRAQHLDQRWTGRSRLSSTVRHSPKTNFPQRHWSVVVSSSVKGHHTSPYALSFSLNSSFWQSFSSNVFLSLSATSYVVSLTWRLVFTFFFFTYFFFLVWFIFCLFFCWKVVWCYIKRTGLL